MKCPTYWLAVIILVLVFGSACTAQDPNTPADLNNDGKVNLIDFALFVTAYQGFTGTGIPLNPTPNINQMLSMEINLLNQQIVHLQDQLDAERLDTLTLKQWLEQSRIKQLSYLNSIYQRVDDIRMPVNVYLYDVSGVGGIHITFDDPNGVK